MHFSPWSWAITIGAVLVLVAFDLFAHRKPKTVTTAAAVKSTLLWTAIGVLFVGVVWFEAGASAAGQYTSAYLLERTLSLDNVFVFVMILASFSIPNNLQHRALLYGTIGALALRAVAIAGGSTLLHELSWMVQVFGVILILSAVRMAREKESDGESKDGRMNRALRRIIPMTDKFSGNRLTVKHNGKRFATPLLAALAVIAVSDIVFAVDSIPAAFGVTEEPFLIFSANAFALLGLRPMTYLVTAMNERFIYLKPALAIVLGLVGTKMIIEPFFEVPTAISLLIIVAVLAIAIGASLVLTNNRTSKVQLEGSVQ